jgi:hypothetical protein
MLTRHLLWHVGITAAAVIVLPLLFGAILIVVGGYFLIGQVVPWFNMGRLWPVLVIGLGVIILVSAGSRKPRATERPADRPAPTE